MAVVQGIREKVHLPLYDAVFVEPEQQLREVDELDNSGTLKFFVNGKPAGEGKIKRSTFRHGLEPFEVGRDSITPISPDYKSPNAFTGTIEKVTFALPK